MKLVRMSWTSLGRATAWQRSEYEKKMMGSHWGKRIIPRKIVIIGQKFSFLWVLCLLCQPFFFFFAGGSEAGKNTFPIPQSCICYSNVKGASSPDRTRHSFRASKPAGRLILCSSETGFEALKLWNVRSGSACARGSWKMNQPFL